MANIIKLMNQRVSKSLLLCFMLSAFLLANHSKAQANQADDAELKAAIIQSMRDKGILGPVIQSRIIGGSVVSSSQDYPFFALWMAFDSIGNVTALCGATIITSNKALTAAHCSDGFANNRMAVIPNFHSVNEDFVADNLYFLSASVEHPSYVNVGQGFDISVLTMNRSTNVQTSLLYGGDQTFVNAIATAIGIGRTTEDGLTSNILREVDVPIVSNAVCSNAFPGIIRSSMICAGYVQGGRSTCQGDSGGPLLTVRNGSQVQVGITSFGRGCARPNIPAGYTRVNSFRSFIRQHAPNARFYNDIVDPVIDGPLTPAPVIPAPASILLLED